MMVTFMHHIHAKAPVGGKARPLIDYARGSNNPGRCLPGYAASLLLILEVAAYQLLNARSRQSVMVCRPGEFRIIMRTATALGLSIAQSLLRAQEATQCSPGVCS